MVLLTRLVVDNGAVGFEEHSTRACGAFVEHDDVCGQSLFSFKLVIELGCTGHPPHAGPYRDQKQPGTECRPPDRGLSGCYLPPVRLTAPVFLGHAVWLSGIRAE